MKKVVYNAPLSSMFRELEACEYSCQARPLENNITYISLKDRVKEMEAQIDELQNIIASKSCDVSEGKANTKKYIKKPIEVEAIQYLREENIFQCLAFCPCMVYNPITNEYEVETLEGNMKLSKGDYIIKGVEGEFYPCKPDIFNKTYEQLR